MNLTLLTLVPGAVIGLGLGVLAFVLAPRTVRAGDALARLGEISQTPTATEPGGISRWDRAGGWVAARMPEVKGLTIPARDLDLLEIPIAEFYGEKIKSALVGFAFPLVMVVFVQLLGQSAALPIAVSFILAIAFWFVPDNRVRRQAAEARYEFTRFVTVYLQMVAVALLGTTTADRALSTAASVSDSWVFRKIRREYQIADTTHTSKWDALERLGVHVGVVALVDLGRTMRLSEARVSLREQLLSKCDLLRKQLVADEKKAVLRQIATMAPPVFFTMIPVLLLLIVPAVVQLLRSF